jgi:hypothetical protein
MKPILDNGIDHLFKSSLEDYEIKPSAESWKRINEQLGSKSQDNKQPYWWAAASVILVLGIGLVFFRSDREVIQLKGKTEIAAVNEELLPIQNKLIVKPQLLKDLSLEEVRIANEKRFLQLMAKTNAPVTKEIHSKSDVKNKNTFAAASSINNDKDDQQNPTTANEENISDNTMITAGEPVLAAVPQSENILDRPINHSGEKSLIKSVGDLVNFVIAKMDGRDQKLLHMSKTEESDMEITQINLGLIKYKKN